MARTASFDVDEVVRAARTLFWQEGFDASIPDLEQATGIARSSLYNTFGSKRGLFDAAVQSYLDEIIRPRLGPLQSDTVDPDAVVVYLTGLRTAFLRTGSLPASSGCLLINTAGSPLALDADVSRVIADYRDEMHTALSRGIAAHRRARGLTVDTPESARLSDAVTALVIAAFALARIDGDRAADNLDSALKLVSSGS